MTRRPRPLHRNPSPRRAPDLRSSAGFRRRPTCSTAHPREILTCLRTTSSSIGGKIADILGPRILAPDLPDRLGTGALGPGADVLGVVVEALRGTVEASHSRVSEAVLRASDVDALDLAGASLSDVEIEHLRAVLVNAQEARWRTVRVTGGRIATLDLARSDVTGVEIRGVRIDYLSLAGATVSDLLVAECTIGSLDAPHATLSRVRFDDTRVDEVDNREWRIEHLDLRGLEALRYLSMPALRGATLTERQVTALAADFAVAAGVHIRD